jgi:hypothetical protein
MQRGGFIPVDKALRDMLPVKPHKIRIPLFA